MNECRSKLEFTSCVLLAGHARKASSSSLLRPKDRSKLKRRPMPTRMRGDWLNFSLDDVSQTDRVCEKTYAVWCATTCAISCPRTAAMPSSS